MGADIVIRADASVAMGTGHVMRCLTLAELLQARGAGVSFAVRELPVYLGEILEKKGFKTHHLTEGGRRGHIETGPLPAASEGSDWMKDAELTREVLAGRGGVEWLIVDNYALDRRWEERVRPFAQRVMVIDDLADRPHDCDLLLDQNLYPDPEHRYEGLVPPHCRRLLGPRYALLRPEFREARKSMRDRNGRVRRILVFFGGSDSSNETENALNALAGLGRQDVAVDVVVGGANFHRERIAEICARLPWATLHIQVSTMARLMAEADLAIGGGGMTTWERCYMGLPTITVIIADNQAESTRGVAAAGACWNLGRSGEVTSDDMRRALESALERPEELRRMGRAALDLMGVGAGDMHESVVRALLGDDRAPT